MDRPSFGTSGHLIHLNHWIRHQAATWISGAALTPTITVNGGAEDNIDIATTLANVLQLHDHAFPIFDTSVASDVYIINKDGAAYTKITDLNACDEDSNGNAIANNERINLVVWGIVSEATGDCKLVVNLPSDFHNSDATAIADALGYSNYTIPPDYTGTGFLIARLTFKYTTADSGTWTLVENLDLRGKSSTGGAVAVDLSSLATKQADNNTITGTTYTVLESDNGKNLIFTNAAAIAVTVPDTLSIDIQWSVFQTTAAGIPTFTRSGTDTINGAATGVAPSAQWKAMYMTQFADGEYLAVL